MGDLNVEPSDSFFTSLCDSNNLINLIKNDTCFKGIASYIDLILTNRHYFFKNHFKQILKVSPQYDIYRRF